jgi:hypothetical protein
MHQEDAYPPGNDRLGPAASLAGREIGNDFTGRDGWKMYHGAGVPGFPQHPHRGFETVTIVRRGLVDHSDSLGATARFGDGDVQWLTAGHGILHSEMFPLLDRTSGNPLELFQIWLNLPRADKLAAPHFTMMWAPTVPRRILRDEAGGETELMVVAGRFGDLAAPPPPPASWASRADSDLAIWTLKMAPRARLTLPATGAETSRRLYFFAGSTLRVGERSVGSGTAIDTAAGIEVPLENGPDAAQLLVLQGRPIGEPVVQHGPFVMTSRAEIEQAFADYHRTHFGGWPWSEAGPVHHRDAGRFARRPDGSLERPAGVAIPGLYQR